MLSLIIVDLLIFGKRFVNTKPPERSQHPKIESYVVRNNSGFKIYDLSGQSFLNLQRELVPNATGYSPTFLATYRDYAWMMGDHLEMEHEPYISLYNLKNLNLLKMLGVKYVISTNELNDNSLNLVMEEHGNFLYFLKSTTRMGYVISETKLIRDENDAFKVITQKKFDERDTLILNDCKAPDFHLPNKYKDVDAEISANEIKAKISTDQEGYFVVREVWYPGWKAYVNGRQVPICKANFLFRAIPINKGINEIYMVYDPISFKVGLLLSSITFLGIVIYLLFRLKNLNSVRKFYNKF